MPDNHTTKLDFHPMASQIVDAVHAGQTPREVAAWWTQAKAAPGTPPEALRRYAFLDALIPPAPRRWPLPRAVPTIGFRHS